MRIVTAILLVVGMVLGASLVFAQDLKKATKLVKDCQDAGPAVTTAG